MRPLYVGVDVGTSNTKVVALQADGHVCYTTSGSYSLLTPQEGYVEQDPDQVVGAVVDALKELASRLQPGEFIKAACFSSAMHSVLLLDHDNRPLTMAITWADTRSKEAAHQLKETEEGYSIYRNTGTPIHPMTPLCKLAWMKEQNLDVFKKAARVVSIKEYIFYKLFGEFVVDHSIASATGMFNIFDRKWHEPALQYAGVEARSLSRPVPASYVFTSLSAGYAGELQAYASTTFSAGASDGCLANYGLGVKDTSHAALTIGTSGAVRVTVNKPVTDPESRLFTYILDDQYCVTGGSMNSGGILMQWFRDQILDGKSDQLGELMNVAGKLPAGSDGLVCLPYLLGERAPHWNSFDKGVFWGVTFQHTRAHFLRALMEGISYNFLQIVDAIEELFEPIDAILATGGFLQAPTWVQILADVLNKPIITSSLGDASAIGAAFMAMQSDGIEQTPSQATRSNESVIYHPNPDHQDLYQKGLPFFKSLYTKLQPDFEQYN